MPDAAPSFKQVDFPVSGPGCADGKASLTVCYNSAMPHEAGRSAVLFLRGMLKRFSNLFDMAGGGLGGVPPASVPGFGSRWHNGIEKENSQSKLPVSDIASKATH